MKTLEIEHIIKFHSKIIAATGGSDGIKDIGLVESALNRANASFDGQDLYSNIIEKISVITHSLISNHGFIDGNKRIGVATMLLLLQNNNVLMQYSQEELIQLGLSVASGDIDNKGIEEWILKHKK
jgi:death-on-curing protein